MNIKIAEENFNLLEIMKINQRYIVIDNFKLVEDNRWFNGMMRYFTNDKREDLLEPIEETFKIISQKRDINRIKKCLEKIMKKFKVLYPFYDKLHKLLEKYYKIHNISYYCDIPKKFFNSCNDYIAILKDNDINDKINDNYTYIYKINKNDTCVTIGENINLKNLLINEEDKAQYVNYTKYIKKLETGDYEIRYNGEKNQILVKFRILNNKYIETYRKCWI